MVKPTEAEIEYVRVRMPAKLQHHARGVVLARNERQSHPRYTTGGRVPPPKAPRKGHGFFLSCGGHSFGYGR